MNSTNKTLLDAIIFDLNENGQEYTLENNILDVLEYDITIELKLSDFEVLACLEALNETMAQDFDTYEEYTEFYNNYGNI